MDYTQERNGRRRKRVSRACDRCRSKKDRCDGGRPTCQACRDSGQVCSYDPVSKKRGLPEGYVRGLEKLWALSISNIDGFEKSILRLLRSTDPDSPQRQKLQSLWTDENVSDHLHETWKSSDLFVELEKLLSSAEVDNATPSTGSEELDINDLSLGKSSNRAKQNTGCSLGAAGGHPSLGGPGISNTAEFLLQPKRKRARLDRSLKDNTRHLRLPADALQIVETYFCYTHSWLPVILKHDVLRTAHQYSQQPLRISSMAAGSGDHAALWAVLSYTTAQKIPCAGTPNGGQSQLGSPVSQAMEFYSNARNLVPADKECFELGHVQALLLLTLVKIGLGDWSAAWMLIEQAIRQATALQNGVNFGPDGGPTAEVCHTLVLGCFVVDTMLSIRLRKPPHIRPEELRTPLLVEDGLEEWAPWPEASPISSGLARSTGSPRARNPLLSRSCFNRLVELSVFLGKISRQDPADITTPVFCKTILKDIQAWCEKLPPVYRLGGIGNKPGDETSPYLLPHQTYLCLTYLATISFFYTRFGSQLQPQFAVLEKSLQLCTAVLASHARLFDQADFPPIFEYPLRAIIDGAQLPSTSPGEVRRQHSHQLDCIGSYLAKSGRTWPIIRRLLQDIKEPIVAPDPLNSQNGPESSSWSNPDSERTLFSAPKTLGEGHGYSTTHAGDSILEFMGLPFDLDVVIEAHSTSHPASSTPGSSQCIVPTTDDLFTPNSSADSPFLGQRDTPWPPDHQETPSIPTIKKGGTPESTLSNYDSNREAHRPSPPLPTCTKRCAPNEIESIFDEPYAQGRHGQTSSLSLAESTMQDGVQRQPTPKSGKDATPALSIPADDPQSQDGLFSPPSIGDLWPPPGFFPDEGGASASGGGGNRGTGMV